jgi:hypothetical protein
MKRLYVLWPVCLCLWLIGSGAIATYVTYAQDAKAPAGQPVANQPQIPQPEPITLDALKVTLADAVLSRDNANAYVQKLQAKIVELSTEIQKLKDELAKAKLPAESAKAEKK